MRSLFTKAASLTVAASILIAGALVLARADAPQPTGSSLLGAGPINVVAHYDRVSFNTAAAMCRADLVAEATVVSVGLGHWNTANGTRPSNIDRRTVLTRGYSIVTPVSFTGVQTLLDHRSKRSNEFVTLGGGWSGQNSHAGLPQSPRGRPLPAGPGADLGRDRRRPDRK